MTNPPSMSPLRRRPIPGMTSPAPAAAAQPVAPAHPAPRSEKRLATPTADPPTGPPRHRSQDYSATRLVNFRLPVDLHDRYKERLQEIERQYPRIRRPSLTDIVIALLEEAPDSDNEIAELIRRKRASEYSEEA